LNMTYLIIPCVIFLALIGMVFFGHHRLSVFRKHISPGVRVMWFDDDSEPCYGIVECVREDVADVRGMYGHLEGIMINKLFPAK